MFLLAVFVVGFVLGAIAVVCLGALGVLFVFSKLAEKTRKLGESLVDSKDVDLLLSLDSAPPKQVSISIVVCVFFCAHSDSMSSCCSKL